MQHSLDLDRFLLKPDLSDEEDGVKHVQAWLEYEAGKLMYRGKKVTDPDCSVAARKFYRIMWRDFLKDNGFKLRPTPRRFSKDPEKYVQGDWMCSVATTFREGLILFVNDEKHEELKKLFPEGSEYGVGGLNTYVPILLCDIACPNSKKQFQEFWGDPVLQNFIRSAYTFANLIIVPDGFNSGRGTKATNDYWDETLRLYFNEFDSKPPLQYRQFDVGTPFHKLVKASRDNGGDELFLDEWLDKDKDDEYKPLPDKDLTTLDDWRDDWHALMQEMTDRIVNRRDQMLARIG